MPLSGAGQCWTAEPKFTDAHGEAKTKTATLVEALYSFDNGRNRKAIAENGKKAEELKSNQGFVFEVSVFL